MQRRTLLSLLFLLAVATLGLPAQEPPTPAPPPQVAPAPLGMPGWAVTDQAPLGPVATLERSGQFFFDHLKALSPGQTAAVWLGLVATLVLAFDWKRLFRARNLVLALLLLPAFLFFDLDAQSSQFTDVVAWSRFRLITAAIMGLQLLTLLWALVARLRDRDPFRSLLPLRAQRALALLFLLLSLGTVFVGEGADSSIYTNYGAQRLRERGKLPYGDPWLARGTACAYGPAIYVMILPAQILADPRPLNPPEALPGSYRRVSGLPVRATVAALVLVAFAGTVMLGKRLGGPEVGWTLAALVFSSPYLLGVGSAHSTLVGAMNISDTAPIAFILLAMAWLARRPLLAGLSLAQATACGFFPILFVPPILFWYGRRRPGLGRFLVGYALIGIAYLALVLLLTEPQGDDGPIRVFLDCTFGMQERPADYEAMRVGYGDSVFGFWGSHPRLRNAVLGLPGGAERKPWKWLFLVLVTALASLRARRARLGVLLASCGALALAVQLIRLHASGVHVIWYLPLLLAPLLASGLEDDEEGGEAAVAAPAAATEDGA